MPDGRKNNGAKKGENRGQGRKSKAKEEQVRRLGLAAITKIYGSVDKYYEHIATQSKESFPHLKLLQEYVFGKPKEVIEMQDEEKEHDYTDYTDKDLDSMISIIQKYRK